MQIADLWTSYKGSANIRTLFQTKKNVFVKTFETGFTIFRQKNIWGNLGGEPGEITTEKGGERGRTRERRELKTMCGSRGGDQSGGGRGKHCLLRPLPHEKARNSR